jgi:hypothetical protein
VTDMIGTAFTTTPAGQKGTRIDLMINSLFYYIRHMTEQHVIRHTLLLSL